MENFIGMDLRNKVIVVTGATKGFGFEVVKVLSKYSQVVYLTSQDAVEGQTAIEKLQNDGLNAFYYQLDIENEENIKHFAGLLKENHNGIDILINNDSIGFKFSNLLLKQRAEQAISHNFFGTLNVCKHLFPLLRRHGRVVNISSKLVLMHRFVSPNDTLRSVTQMMNEYVEATINDEIDWSHIQPNGYVTERDSITLGQVKNRNFDEEIDLSNPENRKRFQLEPDAYTMSKIGVTALTPVLQDLFDRSDIDRKNIIVNSCIPGLTESRVSREKRDVELQKGLETVLMLATLQESTSVPRGEFIAEHRVISNLIQRVKDDYIEKPKKETITQASIRAYA